MVNLFPALLIGEERHKGTLLGHFRVNAAHRATTPCIGTTCMMWQVQDASWRELLRFCAARGAFRGAGSEIISSLMRDGAPGDGSLFGFADALSSQAPRVRARPSNGRACLHHRLQSSSASLCTTCGAPFSACKMEVSSNSHLPSQQTFQQFPTCTLHLQWGALMC